MRLRSLALSFEVRCPEVLVPFCVLTLRSLLTSAARAGEAKMLAVRLARMLRNDLLCTYSAFKRETAIIGD